MNKALLADDIKAFQDEQLPSIPSATLNTLMSELQMFINRGLAEKSTKPNFEFPEFDLPDSNNVTQSLRSSLNSGPLVIRFYRGA